LALQIFLNATLRQYAQGYDPFKGISLEVPAGTTVAQVISILNIPATEVTLLMVDGRSREPEFILQGHERLGLFPPIGGG
jgi:sulfur carrier protein ThiS